MSPDDAQNPLAGDQGAVLSIPAPAPDAPLIDWDELGLEYLAKAKKRDAIARYEFDCQKGYPDTNFEDARLLAYKEAIQRVLSWQYGPKGMILSGPTGRGKTRAVFGLYRRLACEEGRSARYMFAGDWFSTLQGEIRYGKDEARAWVEGIASHPLVILDDLGQEAVMNAKQDWAEAWFFRFLDIRIAKRLPLIVTTNLDASAMASAFNSSGSIRAHPLIRRLLELTAVVKFEETPPPVR